MDQNLNANKKKGAEITDAAFLEASLDIVCLRCYFENFNGDTQLCVTCPVQKIVWDIEDKTDTVFI